MTTPAQRERDLIGCSGDKSHAAMTLQEVADIMTERGYPMTLRAVQFTENRALYKLRMKLLDIGNEAIERNEPAGMRQV